MKILLIGCFLFALWSDSEAQMDTLADRLRAIKVLSDSVSLPQSAKDSVSYALVTKVSEDNDSIIEASIKPIHISSYRRFDNRDDERRYRKYKRYASNVYPYAREAIRIFREVDYATEHMRKRKRKRYIKKLSKELKVEFEDPLRKLSKTEGKILVKMIERELNIPMFELIKKTQGRWKAFYYNQSSKLYGYRLKEAYREGDNPILDLVFNDFDLTFN